MSEGILRVFEKVLVLPHSLGVLSIVYLLNTVKSTTQLAINTYMTRYTTDFTRGDTVAFVMALTFIFSNFRVSASTLAAR